MKIFTLFLSLFLALLPEGVPASDCPSWQDTFLEQLDEVEEEAVIRTVQTQQKQFQRPSESVFDDFHPGLIAPTDNYFTGFCFEKQWLRNRKLRL